MLAALTPRRGLRRVVPAVAVESFWIGAPTTDGATVALKLNRDASNVRLRAVSPDGRVFHSSVETTSRRLVKLTLRGLDANTTHALSVLVDGRSIGGKSSGTFRTLPSGRASFRVAFGGDADQGSNHEVWDAIRLSGAVLFQHLGDTHYYDFNRNYPEQYRYAYEERLASPRQGLLMRSMSCLDMWDDHDYADDNSNASAPSRPAATSIYRERVPHFVLPDANGSIYYSYEIGRVLFIVTDQRSAASPSSMANGPGKSMLGAAQRSWFENLIAASPGKLIVWICPRIFSGPSVGSGDAWGGYGVERAALVGHIHTHAPGRVVVIAADGHYIGIDSGMNHDFLAGGGEPLPTFQAAPLDTGPFLPVSLSNSYSAGTSVARGQFGTMDVVDQDSTLEVLWRGCNSKGEALITHSMTFTP